MTYAGSRATPRAPGARCPVKMAMMTNHALDEVLEEYALNRLSPDQNAELEEHLLVCHACQDRLRETEEFIEATRIAASRLEHDGERWSFFSQRWWGRLGRMAPAPKAVWAFAAAAIALTAVYVPYTQLSRPPAEEVSLQAVRGMESRLSSQAAAGARLTLRIDLKELPPLAAARLEVVDAGGAAVWEGRSPVTGQRLAVTLPRPLPAGQYWVRLYGPEDRLLREFGLETVRR